MRQIFASDIAVSEDMICGWESYVCIILTKKNGKTLADESPRPNIVKNMYPDLKFCLL